MQAYSVAAAKLAADGAVRNAERSQSRAGKAAEAQMERMADAAANANPSERELFELCRKCNAYRVAYGPESDKPIYYTWPKKEYTPKMGVLKLRAEHHNISVALGAQNAPELFREGTSMVANWLEMIIMSFNSPAFNPYGFAKTLDKQMAAGYLDDEIKQLMIEYGGWFTFSPMKRFLGKISLTAGSAMRKNYGQRPLPMALEQQAAANARPSASAAAQSAYTTMQQAYGPRKPATARTTRLFSQQ